MGSMARALFASVLHSSNSGQVSAQSRNSKPVDVRSIQSSSMSTNDSTPLSSTRGPINTFYSALKEKFQINVNGDNILMGTILEDHILTHTFLSDLAQAANFGGTKKRREEFSNFVRDGNTKTLAAFLLSGARYEDLWVFEGEARALQDEVNGRPAFRRLKDELIKAKASDKGCQSPGLRLDTFLPLSKGEAECLFGFPLGSTFFSHQYAFIPHHFQQFEHFKRVDPRIRLPILERIKIGSGASSVVYKVVIAENGWMNGSFINRKPYAIALKIYNFGVREDHEEQRRVESDILETQRKASQHSDNLVPGWGLFDDEHELGLFMPLANMTMADLVSRNSSDQWSFRQLLRSLAGLGEGLHFLHKGPPKDGDKIRTYHRDFRPNNVFIYNTDFKAADFGMSRILVDADGKQKDRRPSPDNAGTYSAPPNIVQTSRDVWSYTCMIIVAIAWKVGGPAFVNDFAAYRKKGSIQQKFWASRTSGSSGEATTYDLNSNFVRWVTLVLNPKIWDVYGSNESTAWLIGLLDYLVHYLQNAVSTTEPALKAKDITRQLWRISKSFSTLDRDLLEMPEVGPQAVLRVPHFGTVAGSEGSSVGTTEILPLIEPSGNPDSSGPLELVGTEVSTLTLGGLSDTATSVVTPMVESGDNHESILPTVPNSLSRGELNVMNEDLQGLGAGQLDDYSNFVHGETSQELDENLPLQQQVTGNSKRWPDLPLWAFERSRWRHVKN